MEIRDKKTRELFIKYLEEHPSERFFQAVRNFTRHYLNLKGVGINRPFILASELPPAAIFEEDTFHWECDGMIKEEDERTEKENNE